jgi:hypothetical protein
MIEQNSFNKTSNNLEILIIRHLSSPKTGSFVFLQKKASSIKQADLRDMSKKASKSVYTSTIVVSPDPMSLNPSNSLAMKAPENTEEDLDYPEPADKGDIKMDYSFD